MAVIQHNTSCSEVKEFLKSQEHIEKQEHGPYLELFLTNFIKMCLNYVPLLAMGVFQLLTFLPRELLLFFFFIYFSFYFCFGILF